MVQRYGSKDTRRALTRRVPLSKRAAVHQKVLGWFATMLAFLGTMVCGAYITGGWTGVGWAFIFIGGSGTIITLIAFAEDHMD